MIRPFFHIRGQGKKKGIDPEHFCIVSELNDNAGKHRVFHASFEPYRVGPFLVQPCRVLKTGEHAGRGNQHQKNDRWFPMVQYDTFIHTPT